MDEVTSELWMLEAKALFVGLKSLCFFVQNCKKLPKKVQRFNAQVFRLVNHHWKMAIWIFWQNSARKNLRETGGLFLGDIDFLLRPAGAAKAKSALWVSRSGRWRKWGQQVPKAEEVMPGDFDVAVDGWNPAVAPVDMVNIPLYLQGFLHTSWLFGISEPMNSRWCWMSIFKLRFGDLDHFFKLFLYAPCFRFKKEWQLLVNMF